MPEPDEALDESLRSWLVNALSRRVVPANYRTPLEQLIAWAQSYRDGKALHDFLKAYPLAGTQTEPDASLLHTQAQSASYAATGHGATPIKNSHRGYGQQSSTNEYRRARYDPQDNAERLAEGQTQRGGRR